jgi:hypothetical protein
MSYFLSKISLLCQEIVVYLYKQTNTSGADEILLFISIGIHKQKT